MMNRKQYLRDHPLIRCPKNMQATDRETSPAESWFQKSCCYESLPKSHFGLGAPSPADLLHMPQNTLKAKHLREVASDPFTTHSPLMLETYTLCDAI